MPTTVKHLLSVLLAYAGFAVPALPASDDGGTNQDRKPSFEKADANDDGIVSIKEAREAGASKFEAEIADLDDDGKLTEYDWRFVEMKRDQNSS